MNRLLSLIVVLGLIAGACSDASSDVIATIDGDAEITVGDVAALFDSDTLPIDEGLRDAIFAVVARHILVTGLMDDFGVELDTAEVDSVYDNLVSQMETAGLTPEESLGIPDAGLGMIRFNAEVGVIRSQAVDGLVAQPEFVETYFSDPATYTTVCAHHILVATEEEAGVVVDRLEAGEEFATVAAEVSLDTPSGDLGCSYASRYVPEFAAATVAAEIGAVTGPVETTFGWHVIVVNDRIAPTLEEVAADPSVFLSEADLSALWNQWINDKLDAAVVEIDPAYGTWSDVGILPPDEG